MRANILTTLWLYTHCIGLLRKRIFLHQKKCERLEQTYDGTMSSLKEFTKSFYYDRDVKEALDMVYEKLREQPAGCAAAFAADELEQFFKLCGDLARYNPGDEQKILNMARTMMGGLAA